MNLKLLKIPTVLVMAAVLLPIGASATMIRDDPFVVKYGGTGFGNVLTVLTLHTTPTEAGSVAWDGSNDVYTGDAVTTHSETHPLANTGWLDAFEIRVIFNVNETGGAKPVTLADLVLNIYAPIGGTPLWSSGAFPPYLISDISQGTGPSVFSYMLDPAQAAALNAAVIGAAGSFPLAADYRVGLAAAVEGVDDGPDTFFVARVLDGGGGGEAVIPEPSTVVLMGAGLGLLVLARRRRRLTH